jgi:hypothetical protein
MTTTTTTFEALTEMGREFNRRHAPGSETNEWQDYVAEVVGAMGVGPWHDSILETPVPPVIAAYWTEIFSG